MSGRRTKYLRAKLRHSLSAPFEARDQTVLESQHVVELWRRFQSPLDVVASVTYRLVMDAAAERAFRAEKNGGGA